VVAKGQAAVRARLETLGVEGIAHVVADAVSDDDLKTIAAAVADMPLTTGGSAIAGQLPRLYVEQGLVAAPLKRTVQSVPKGGQVVLSGSCSAMTRKQVAYYAGKNTNLRLDPVALESAGAGAAEDWLQQRETDEPKLIFATAEPDEVRKAQQTLGLEKASYVVEQALAGLAKQAFRNGVRRFVIAGGETSGAITQALGVTRLEIGPEIAPGVPWVFAEVEGERVALALKSGNFGSETFFEDAFKLLEAA
jgi:3-dehydrotetronate 4-kinase